MWFKGGKYSYFTALLVNTSAFLVGIVLAWPSPMLEKFNSDDLSSIPIKRHLDSDEISWIGSLASLGSCFSPFITAYVMNKFGRKVGVLQTLLLSFIGYTISAFANTVTQFYVARIFMGFAVGSSFTVLPVYIVETTETVNRGVLSASTTSIIMCGILFTYVLGPYVSIMVFNVVAMSISIASILICIAIVPETPFYLTLQGKDNEAIKSLTYLRRKPKDIIEQELNEIKTLQKSLEKGSISDLYKDKATIKGIIFSFLLTMLQQLSGITILIGYSQRIFKMSGTDIPTEICSIIVGTVQFSTSFICPTLSDRFGRRKLLIFSTICDFLAEFALGTYFYFEENDYNVDDVKWFPVLCLVLYIFFYNCGFGALPWGLMSEFLPPNVISIASSLITFLYWVVGFFMAKYFDAAAESLGLDVTFWGFSAFCLICTVFGYFFIFETNGLTRTQIQEKLNK